MSQPKGKEDPFLSIAIPFLLGVVVGFTLILLGFILFVLAGLAALEDTNEISGWVWFLSAVISEVVGVYLMKRSLADSPEPGVFGPGAKKR